MLPVLVPLLRRDNELVLSDAEVALLVRMSAATIDRRLAPERFKLLSRGRSHTKPGTLLKSQIPSRTWTDWDDAVPGFGSRRQANMGRSVSRFGTFFCRGVHCCRHY